MKRAYIQMTHELLRAKLDLPDTVQIEGCETPQFSRFVRIYLTGTHEALPETPEGGCAPYIDGEDIL